MDEILYFFMKMMILLGALLAGIFLLVILH